jgi:hypothetical protein
MNRLIDEWIDTYIDRLSVLSHRSSWPLYWFFRHRNLTISDIRDLKMLLLVPGLTKWSWSIVAYVTDVSNTRPDTRISTQQNFEWILTRCMSPGLNVSLRVIEYHPWTVCCRRQASLEQLHKFCCDLISYCAILRYENTNFVAINRLLGSCAVYNWLKPTFRRNASPPSSA